MLSALQAPLFFGLIAAFATVLGLLAVALRGDWSEKYSGLFALAAGGMLLTLTLLHIAPEAIERSSVAPQLILAGFLGGLMINYLVRIFFPDRGAEMGRAGAITPLVAIAIHSFLDGAIYAVTFSASFEAGVYASSSLILHELPEGIMAFAILRRYGFTNRSSFIWGFLAAGLTTPLGVLLSEPFVYGLGDQWVGGLFAVSAGLLLYVATGPLMEPMRDEPKTLSLAALGSGVAIAVAMVMLPLH
ncbi:MAG: ZIP family metal transporter [Hyphomonadaceae bacterium]